MPTPLEELRAELYSETPKFTTLKDLAEAAGLEPEHYKPHRSTVDLVAALRGVVAPELPGAGDEASPSPPEGPGPLEQLQELDAELEKNRAETAALFERFEALLPLLSDEDRAGALLHQMKRELRERLATLDKDAADRLEEMLQSLEKAKAEADQVDTDLRGGQADLRKVRAKLEAAEGELVAVDQAVRTGRGILAELEAKIAAADLDLVELQAKAKSAGESKPDDDEASRNVSASTPPPPMDPTAEAPALFVIAGRYLAMHAQNEVTYEPMQASAQKMAGDELEVQAVKPTEELLAWLVPWSERPDDVGPPKITEPRQVAGANQVGAAPRARPGQAPSSSAPTQRGPRSPGRGAVRDRRAHPAGQLAILVEKHPEWAGFNATCQGVVDEHGELVKFYGATPGAARSKAEAAGLEQLLG